MVVNLILYVKQINLVTMCPELSLIFQIPRVNASSQWRIEHLGSFLLVLFYICFL